MLQRCSVLADQLFNQPMTSSSNGSIDEPKDFTNRPSSSIRNLWKFHFTEASIAPFNALVVNHW